MKISYLSVRNLKKAQRYLDSTHHDQRFVKDLAFVSSLPHGFQGCYVDETASAKRATVAFRIQRGITGLCVGPENHSDSSKSNSRIHRAGMQVL